jgi:hypothetical protein
MKKAFIVEGSIEESFQSNSTFFLGNQVVALILQANVLTPELMLFSLKASPATDSLQDVVQATLRSPAETARQVKALESWEAILGRKG